MLSSDSLGVPKNDLQQHNTKAKSYRMFQSLLSVTWVYLVPITTAAAAAAATTTSTSTTNDSAIMGMILLCYRAREVRNGTGTAIAMKQLLLLLLLLMLFVSATRSLLVESTGNQYQ